MDKPVVCTARPCGGVAEKAAVLAAMKAAATNYPKYGKVVFMK